MTWQHRVAQQLLQRQLSHRVWRKWASTIPQLSSAPWDGPSQVTVAVVQFRLDPVVDIHSWLQRLTVCFQQAKSMEADIIVFGEDMAMPLWGLLQKWAGNATENTPLDALAPWLKALAPIAYQYWHQTMQHLARRFALTTVAGSALKQVGKDLMNVAVTFDAEGNPIASQAKLHLFPIESALKVSPGPVLAYQKFAPWPLMTMVCNDATYFESFRMAQARGALMVAVPIADPEPLYSEAKARRGTWARVQETPVAGLVGAGTGNLFGLNLTGKAAIYVPACLTPDGSGILAESTTVDGEEVTASPINLAALADLQRRLQSRDLTAPWLDTVYSPQSHTSFQGANPCIF